MDYNKNSGKVGLILAIVVIVLMVVCVIFLLVDKGNDEVKPDLVAENNGNNVTQEPIITRETIDVNSNNGKMISDYLKYVWMDNELYMDNMPEFLDVKNAPKEYLAACTSSGVMRQTKGDIYEAKVEFSVFNNKLVELFGEKANGMLSEEDIEKVFFVEKNPDNTYHFNGFDGSETHYTSYTIKDIEKENDLFYVNLYEYKIESNRIDLGVGDVEEGYTNVYDRNGNLILKITIKATVNGDRTTYMSYDENGNEVDNIQEYLLAHYENKLTTRTVELKFDESNNTFNIVSNKLSVI